MTFDASRFATPERQYSDTEAVQSPVADNTGAMSAMDSAQLLGQVGQSAFALKGTYDRQGKAEAQARAAEQATLFSNQYDAAIEKYSAAVSSGEMNKLQADTHLTKVKKELINMGASADDLNKTEIAALKTISGKALMEGSAQERAEKLANETFKNSLAWNPYHTPEQQEEAKRDFFQKRTEEAARQEKLDNLKLKAAQRVEGSAEKKELKLKAKQEQIDILNGMLRDSPSLMTSYQSQIIATYEDQVVKLGEAQAKLNAERSWNTFKNTEIRKAQLAANEVEGGLPVQKDAYLDMLERRSTFLDELGDAQLVANLQEVEKKDQAKLELALLNEADVRQAKVTTEMFGGPDALTHFQGLRTRAATSVNDFVADTAIRDYGDPPPTLGRDKESVKANREMVQASISDFLNGDYEGDPRNLDKLLSGHLARLSEDFKTLPKEEIDEALRYYSLPEFGSYIKQRGLSNADLDNVNRQLHAYKASTAKTFVNFVKETLGAEEKKARLTSTNPRLRMAAARIATVDDFDLVFEGGQVLLKANKERARDEAGELNEKVAGPLTRIIRTDSNLSGQSEEQIFNIWKEQLWPSGEEENNIEKVGSAEPEDTIDYSTYSEDKLYRVKGTDQTFRVKNGVRIDGD